MVVGIIIGLVGGIILCCIMFAFIMWAASHQRSETQNLQIEWNKNTMEVLERNNEAFRGIENAIWNINTNK